MTILELLTASDVIKNANAVWENSATRVGTMFKNIVQHISDTTVKLTGNETIAGTKTFSASPVVPAPTADMHPVTLSQYISPILERKSDVATFAALSTTYPHAVKGWASMVTGEGCIYSYNGVGWNNTGLKEFTGDMLIKKYQTLSRNDKIIINRNLALKDTELFEKGKNLFNGNDVDSVSGLLNAAGGIDSSASYSTTHIIEVDGGCDYNVSVKHFICYYDENLNFINRDTLDAYITNYHITTPTNARYLRCSVPNAYFAIFQIQTGLVNTGYEKYYNSLKISNINKDVIRTKDVDIDIKDLSFFEQSKNLFDKTTITIGKFVNWITGNLSVNLAYDASDYIPVISGMEYFYNIGSAAPYLAWYDSSKAFISGTNTNPFPLVAPINAKFIRFTITSGTADLIQFELGSFSTALQPNYIPTFDFANVIKNKTSWFELIWQTLGDSITAQNKWQPYVCTLTGLTVKNDGVGGTLLSGSGTTAMVSDTRINALDANASIVSVLGGTNDWASNVVLGLQNSTDITEFYGALNVLIQKLLTKYPNKVILFMTTPYGELYNYTPRGWINAYTNNQGHTTKDYANAIINRCEAYNIPYIDLHKRCGWNTLNIRTYITDDGGLLHPSDFGAKRMASIVAGVFKTIEIIR